ncbi:MAG: phosphoglucomutase/phosphomannomutase family protein, partial [Lachnospiraceae bacterium]
MIHFGTGGWRAVIADDFTRENIRLLTAGLCSLMEKEGLAGSEVCVGYDRRFLSKESAHWIAEVLTGNGFPVYMINRASPTPLIMYTVRNRGLSYGMCVTASHNPAIYNGIKVFTKGGRDADREVTLKIEEEIRHIDPEKISSIRYEDALGKGLIKEENPLNGYIDSILHAVDVEKIKDAHLRVAIDPMYGVGQQSLLTILMTCRCDVDALHIQHDTLFGGHMPAPNAEALGQLSHNVVEDHCDVGIATDGDADRLGAIDEKGRYVHPNAMLVLLYHYLLEYRHWDGPCVRNNSTTMLLDRVAKAHHQVCYEVPVGFKWISAKMAEKNAIIGGESSGGMAIRGHISGKDGIYAAALLLEMLAVMGKPLSAIYDSLLDRYGHLAYGDAAIPMTRERKEELMAVLFEDKRLPKFDNVIDHISYEDGVKIYFADESWVICRFS